MCLIVHRIDPTKHIPDDILDYNLRVNDDGFGIAWREPETNTLMFIKYAPEQAKQFRKQLKKIDRMKVEYVAHFRMATRGLKNLDNAHPYQYKESEDVGVLVFHNGVIGISGDTSTKDMSDTGIFVDRVLSKMQPKWYLNEATTWLIEETIGWSRLLIWPSDGDPVHLDGGKSWTERGGIWYSTTPGGKSYGTSNYKPSTTATGSQSNYSKPTGPNYGAEWQKGYHGPAYETSIVGDETEDADADHAGEEWWDRTISALERKQAKDRSSTTGAKPDKGLVEVKASGRDWDGLTWDHAGHAVYPLDEVVPDSQGEIGGQCGCTQCDTIGTFFSMGGYVYIEIPHHMDDDDDGESLIVKSEDFLLPVDGPKLLTPGGNDKIVMPEMAAV